MDAGRVSVLLLRHGQSEWNSVRRWQGRADSPLTRLGRRQAEQCADDVAASGHRFGGVWASSLRRAHETAEIIAARLDLGPVRADDRLVEADAGEWQGLTPDEIDERYPGYRAADRRPPTFETFDDVVARTGAALADIAGSLRREERPGIIVSHSGVIRSLIRSLGESDHRIPNLGGLWLHRDPGSPASGSFLLGERFDAASVVRSGIDSGGEDPGHQSDQTDAHGRSQR